MITTELPDQGVVFWPVGTGDSTTVVLDAEHVIQVDLHDMAMADEEDAVVAAVVDRLVEVLPQRDGEPYLSAFILTHADKDHCLGFADLLSKVTIDELWATPRMWRELKDGDASLCEDAQAFHKEVKRRVNAIKKAVTNGTEPAAGDLVRVVGYDTDQSKHAYHDLPDTYLSIPGQAVSWLAGEDLSDRFEIFIHAPFKDDCASERNETSLAFQLTLRNPEDVDAADGKVLLFGDLAHDTIVKIFEYSVAADRAERLEWDVLLAPHHCSKKVMYALVDGKNVLQDDVLDAFEEHQREGAIIVSSSDVFPPKDVAGLNPPHRMARDRYQERVEADNFICTAMHPDEAAPQPIVLGLTDEGLDLVASGETVAKVASEKALSRSGGLLLSGAAILAALGATKAIRAGKAASSASPGLSGLTGQINAARSTKAAPQAPVGFGSAGE